MEFNGPSSIVTSLTLGTYDFYKKNPQRIMASEWFFHKLVDLLRMVAKYQNHLFHFFKSGSYMCKIIAKGWGIPERRVLEARGQRPVTLETPRPKAVAWCKNQEIYLFSTFFFCIYPVIPDGYLHGIIENK